MGKANRADVQIARAESARLLRLPDVRGRTGLGRSMVYHLIRQGKFPAPIKLSERCSAWLESDIETWIQSRLEAAGRAV